MRRLVLLLLSLSATAAQADGSCLAPPYHVTGAAGLQDLSGALRNAREALRLFPSLERTFLEQAPELCLSDRMDNALAYLDVPANRIVLSRALAPEMTVAVLLHELRHLEQIATGICPTDSLAMREYAFASFAMEADASAISLLVAWSMKEKGNAGPWTALSTWATQADIAETFRTEISASGDAVRAVAAAFDQWFASEDRRTRYYIAACSDYLDRQDTTHALPRYALMPESFLTRLCRLPDGTPYPCAVSREEPHTD